MRTSVGGEVLVIWSASEGPSEEALISTPDTQITTVIIEAIQLKSDCTTAPQIGMDPQEKQSTLKK